MDKLFCEILNMCYEITRQTEAHCFFEYAGHINTFQVMCFRDGWKEEMSSEEFTQGYVAYNKSVTITNLREAKRKLSEIAESLGVEL